MIDIVPLLDREPFRDNEVSKRHRAPWRLRSHIRDRMLLYLTECQDAGKVQDMRESIERILLIRDMVVHNVGRVIQREAPQEVLLGDMHAAVTLGILRHGGRPGRDDMLAQL